MHNEVGGRGSATLLLAMAVLGPASALVNAQQLATTLQCLRAGSGLPQVGIYSLLVEDEKLLCVAPREQADGSLLPCLRIGSVFVGQERDSVERRLGKPWRLLDSRTRGQSMVAYLVKNDSGAENQAHWIVEYETLGDSEITFSLQLTGTSGAKEAQFSCIHLGDSQADVTSQLGPAAATELVELDERGTRAHAWYFGDSPFSIEFVNGRVYSLRAWRPAATPPRLVHRALPP